MMGQLSSGQALLLKIPLADLEQADGIRCEHLAEALQYRPTML
jgi:predicted ATPase with chaperone activity